MPEAIINILARKFNIDTLTVRSWIEHKNLENTEEAEVFFIENKAMIQAQPFVKWVGGKRQLLSQLKDLFPKDFGDYHEPFLGGGAVFFHLQKKQSFLSDINAELINTYQIIQKQPFLLIDFLQSCQHSKEFYSEIRAWDRIENLTEKYTPVQRAGRFIYLNRTCFNGLYRVNSKGQFNVPMGAYKNPDFVQRENIMNVSKLLNETKASIKLQSFDAVIKNTKAGDFVYFDPPYDTLTETANFTSYNESGFGRDMQIKLRDVCLALHKKGVKFMMSNHNTEFIREIYKDFRFEIVQARRNVNRNAQGRGKVEEIVVMNY